MSKKELKINDLVWLVNFFPFRKKKKNFKSALLSKILFISVFYQFFNCLYYNLFVILFKLLNFLVEKVNNKLLTLNKIWGTNCKALRHQSGKKLAFFLF